VTGINIEKRRAKKHIGQTKKPKATKPACLQRKEGTGTGRKYKKSVKRKQTATKPNEKMQGSDLIGHRQQ